MGREKKVNIVSSGWIGVLSPTPILTLVGAIMCVNSTLSYNKSQFECYIPVEALKYRDRIVNSR